MGPRGEGGGEEAQPERLGEGYRVGRGYSEASGGSLEEESAAEPLCSPKVTSLLSHLSGPLLSCVPLSTSLGPNDAQSPPL